MKRVLIYSHDTYGLGNIRRMLTVAEHLVTTDPNVSVLILSGSPMLHAFRISPGIDYVKLPCLTRTDRGRYAVKSLGLDTQQTIHLRSNLIAAAVEDFDPDLVLVDKKPFGVACELQPALLRARRKPDAPKLVLLLRDILDTPRATHRLWRKKGYHEAIRTLYDRVLVVGSPQVFDMVEEYRFPPASRERTHSCGYLRREPGLRSRAEVRRELGFGDRPLVLVTAGGGEDGCRLLSSYLEGLGGRLNGHAPATLMFCGPEMEEGNRGRILAAAESCPSVVVKDFTDDMMSYMGAADLVVSMAGYNTVCEILTLRKRAIVVPRFRPVPEQWIRGARMADLGLLKAIHPDELTPAGLMASVDRELALANVRSKDLYEIDLEGLANIGSHIRSLLYPECLRRAGAAEMSC